jgi:Asp-tRNA(Asn)/Glu-tRNA(Gln) amidotransferase A subunit family amidase
MGAEASQALRDKPESGLSAKLRDFLREGAQVTPERLRAAGDQAVRCRRELDGVFASVDALITPAAPAEAPEGLAATGDPIFCRLWTLLGTPSISLPVLSGPAGLPIGLQVIGPRNGDGDLLSAAAWIQGAFAEHQPPPRS